MSLTYILVALLAVILNNVLVERLSMHTRITVGTSTLSGFHPLILIFSVFVFVFLTHEVARVTPCRVDEYDCCCVYPECLSRNGKSRIINVEARCLLSLELLKPGRDFR